MKELLSTFFYILYKFYLCVSKIQVRATTVFEFYFWSLLEQHVHTFKFFKPHFWKDFITKLILFLLQQCLSLLSLSLSLFFFCSFWLLISAGALEIAGRVNTTVYSSSNSFPGVKSAFRYWKKESTFLTGSLIRKIAFLLIRKNNHVIFL